MSKVRMTLGWKPWVATDAEDDDDEVDELDTDLGALNAAETFLLPLAFVDAFG
jgi:hypothetical protein